MKRPRSAFALRSLLSMDLSRRSGLRELLDTQSPDDPEVAATLRNLERINSMLSGIRHLCTGTLLKALREHQARAAFIIDLGCGSGDLLRWLSRRCAALHIHAQLVGIDFDPRVAALARMRCEQYPCITIIERNAAHLHDLPHEPDWIVSNHFLHHLATNEACSLLRMVSQVARRGAIMNDLVRSRLSLVQFHLLCRILAPSGYTAHDGTLSILRSFTRIELAEIIRDAGVSDHARVTRSGIGHSAVVLRK
ncbi:MAG: methyltransferase domain-containing protein [Chitinispirillaceae bacterium]|nr:methyltransferase domain-containing protein [Chitinispirillaceae bacterium]